MRSKNKMIIQAIKSQMVDVLAAACSIDKDTAAKWMEMTPTEVTLKETQSEVVGKNKFKSIKIKKRKNAKIKGRNVPKNHLLKVLDLQNRWDCSGQSIRRHVANGLPAVRLAHNSIRFRLEDVKTYEEAVKNNS